MRWGRYELTFFNFGGFRLDGGAMFGSVPKNIWAKRIAADHENCIPLATRCLLLEDGARKILIDVGMGEKYNDKSRAIFAVETPRPLPCQRQEITDIILTHLHFDHAGGISTWGTGEADLLYPQATVHLQGANLHHAKHPTTKDRASYLVENIEPLKHATLNLLDGDGEVLPDIAVHRVDGHTVGQQWIEIRRPDGPPLFYPTDLIPTAHHIPLPFHMGYDLCAMTLLTEKEHFLTRALNEQALVVFEHDSHTPMGHIGKDERGHFSFVPPAP